MSNTMEKLSYKVKDISLADWGRKEIKLAEEERKLQQRKDALLKTKQLQNEEIN
jgi:S-adenosylhomocysteine hydrolase